jgi:hypothetical protein
MVEVIAVPSQACIIRRLQGQAMAKIGWKSRILPGSLSPNFLEYILSYVCKDVIICNHIHYFGVVPVVIVDRFLIDIGGHARSGGVQVQLPHRIGSSRWLRILMEIGMLPGG